MRILRSAERTEEGIAPDTSAAMRVKKSVGANNPREEEIWIMYQTKPAKKIIMISAWRYPGRTKPGAPIPIPDDIADMLAKLT